MPVGGEPIEGKNRPVGLNGNVSLRSTKSLLFHDVKIPSQDFTAVERRGRRLPPVTLGVPLPRNEY